MKYRFSLVLNKLGTSVWMYCGRVVIVYFMVNSWQWHRKSEEYHEKPKILQLIALLAFKPHTPNTQISLDSILLLRMGRLEIFRWILYGEYPIRGTSDGCR
jgi:hypothetical protein